MWPSCGSCGIPYTSEGVKRGGEAFVSDCAREQLCARIIKSNAEGIAGEAGTIQPASLLCFDPPVSGFSEMSVFGKMPKAKGNPDVRF